LGKNTRWKISPECIGTAIRDVLIGASETIGRSRRYHWRATAPMSLKSTRRKLTGGRIRVGTYEQSSRDLARMMGMCLHRSWTIKSPIGFSRLERIASEKKLNESSFFDTSPNDRATQILSGDRAVVQVLKCVELGANKPNSRRSSANEKKIP